MRIWEVAKCCSVQGSFSFNSVFSPMSSQLKERLQLNQRNMLYIGKAELDVLRLER